MRSSVVSAQPSIVRPRKEKVDMETHVVGVREHRQGTRWMSIPMPFSSPNAFGIEIKRRVAIYISKNLKLKKKGEEKRRRRKLWSRCNVDGTSLILLRLN